MLNEKCYYGNFKEYIYSSYDIREYMYNVFKFYFFMNKSLYVSPKLKSYDNYLDGKDLVSDGYKIIYKYEICFKEKECYVR